MGLVLTQFKTIKKSQLKGSKAKETDASLIFAP